MTGAQCYIVVAPAMQCFWNIRFCYLEPIFYLLDIAATVPIVSFKGDAVGTVDVQLRPRIGNSQENTHRASEVSLDSYLGEKLDLMIKIKRASALPRKLCSSVSLRPHLRIIRVLGGIRHMDR